jgi:hypothetical protein
MRYEPVLDDESRTRLEAGGELAAHEKRDVAVFVHRYWMWLMKDEKAFTQHWEGDALVVSGEAYEGWNGYHRFTAEQVRTFALHFFGDPDVCEPDAAMPWIPTPEDEDWMLQDTWVVGTQPEPVAR